MEEKNKVLDYGIYAVVLSAFFYTLSWCYESGYCSYFGIPDSYIRVNVATVLMDGSTVFLIAFTFIALDIAGSSGNVETTAILNFVTTTLFIFAITVFDSLSHGISTGNIIAIIITLSVYFYYSIIWPRQYYRKFHKGQASWMKVQLYYYDSVVRNSEIYGLNKMFGENAFRYLFFGIILALFNYNFGYYHARNQRSFYLLNKNTIILRNYNNNMICGIVQKSGADYILSEVFYSNNKLNFHVIIKNKKLPNLFINDGIRIHHYFIN